MRRFKERTNQRWVRFFGSAAAIKDLVMVLAMAALVGLGAGLLDVLGHLAGLALRYPELHLGEIVAALIALAFGLAVALRRRMSDLGAEIARRQESEARSKESEARLASLFDASSDWVWEMGDELNFTLVSDTAPEPAKALVRAAQPGAEGDQSGLVDDESWARHRADLTRKRAFRNFRLKVLDADGGVHHLELSGQPVHRRDGGFAGYRGTGRDVTREVAAEQEIERLARHDALTGLPNRVALGAQLDHALNPGRHGQHGVLLRLDFDRFKEINGIFGEAAGDLLIRMSAERLRAWLPARALLARLGDDEFAILQSGIDRTESAAALCRELLAKLAEPFDLGGEEVIVTGSIGIAMMPDDGERAEQLLRNADIALARAKADGRGTFCFFEPAMGARLLEGSALERDLRRALAHDEFELHYQPQILAGTPTAVGVEALLRWRHPERGLLSPREFLPVAEESGLMVPLGEWVLRTACAQAVAWREIRVSVNLSSSQFWHRDLAGLVGRMLEESGLVPNRLELEVTEVALLADTQAAFAILDRLRDLGVRVAMDNFGTGYSSLSYLQRVNKIKIDRSFVGALERREDARAAVRAIVSLGRSLGAETCADGVETAEQSELLCEEGCVELQGFYFSRPLEADEISALLQAPAEGETAADDGEESTADEDPAIVVDEEPLKEAPAA